MSLSGDVYEIITDLANLFGDVTDMDKMDAADFTDNAGKIWDLRERARRIKELQGE